MSDGGKGSNPRPFSVDQKTFDSRWDLIFNKGKQFPIESKEETEQKEEKKKSED